MSHSAVYSFHINVDTELREIQDIKNSLNNLCNTTSSNLVKDSINNLFDQINSIESQLKSIGGIHRTLNFNFQLEKSKYDTLKSRLIKTVQNMSIGVSFDDLIKEHNEKLNDLIIQNGFLSKIALDRMEDENISVTPQNFMNMIQIIKQEKINTQKHNTLKNEIKNLVVSQNIDKKLKGSLFNEFMFIDNYQELSDFLPYSKEIINDYNEALNKYKVYTEILKQHKYKSKNLEFIVQTDSENKLKPRYAFIAKFYNPLVKNNSFVLTINLDGTISYDIGDYEKHMCWSLSEEVEKDLEKFGYKVQNKIITRSISGARPLTKAQKLREA